MPSKLPLLAALLLLAGLLLAASIGQAAPPSPAPTALYFEEEFEPEEGVEEEELGKEECALAQEEAAEGIATPAEAAEICAEIAAESVGASAAAPRQCPLRSAKVHASNRNNRLRLTIGYTTSAPTTARVEVRAGKRKLGSYKRKLGRSGVLRLTKPLGKNRPKKVRVRFETSMCRGFQTRSAIVQDRQGG